MEIQSEEIALEALNNKFGFYIKLTNGFRQMDNTHRNQWLDYFEFIRYYMGGCVVLINEPDIENQNAHYSIDNDIIHLVSFKNSLTRSLVLTRSNKIAHRIDQGNIEMRLSHRLKDLARLSHLHFMTQKTSFKEWIEYTVTIKMVYLVFVKF